MAARVLQEAEVSNSAINLKFNHTLDVAYIVNDAFVLTIASATPTAITDPFIDIDLARDYNSIGRILSLYFVDSLTAETTYGLTVTGLKSVNGDTLDNDYFEFTTSASVNPDPEDIVPEAELLIVQDFSIKTVSDLIVSSSAVISENPEATFNVEDVTPRSEISYYLSDTQDDGVVKMTFSEPVAANYLTTEYFKVQRKSISGYVSRWETVSAAIYYDSERDTVLVCMPSIEADQDVVYMTPDRQYWESLYKYRIRISSLVGSAVSSSEQDSDVTPYDLVCYQGSTFTREITITDNAGSIIDLSGYTAQMQARPSAGSSTLIVELSTSNSRIVIDGVNGKITLTLTPVETAAITTSGVYDLELTAPDTTVTRPLEGRFILVPEVTV